MRVYSTLSRQKEDFIAGDPVRMYVCGVTPYDDCHLGHALSYSTFDVIKRYLEFRGFKVKHVQNFTDVDDKIIDRARIRGVSIGELSSRHIESYFADMDALNIRRADVYPRATDEIPKMIEVISGLISKGYAYPAGGSVYFRVSRFPGYGKLSGRDLSQTETTGAHEPGKESHWDFALWKASKPDEPFWDSPWGKGRPGWHIECTAMSLRHLGTTLDIHGGGRDLIFPHHENEIAQSESYTGISPFARYWLHNGMVQVGEEKMSKSLGNLVTVKQLLERYHPDAIRFLVASSQYRNPLTYSEAGLEAAEKGVERLRAAATRATDSGGASLDAVPFRQRFIEAMDDDFNSPQAVAVLFDLAREINRAAEDGGNVTMAQSALKELAGVLGITLARPVEAVSMDMAALVGIAEKAAEQLAALGQDKLAAEARSYVASLKFGGQDSNHGEIADRLVELRRQMRTAKQWKLADTIRSGLAEVGISLEDTPQGTVWKYVKPSQPGGSALPLP